VAVSTLSRAVAIDILARMRLQELSVQQKIDMLDSSLWITSTQIELSDGEILVNFDSAGYPHLLNTYDKYDVLNRVYDDILFLMLRHEYIGVQNQYLKQRLQDIGLNLPDIIGNIEQLYPCPCCRFLTLTKRGEYLICPVCYWEDDGNNDLSSYSSVNHMTLSAAIDNFKQFGAIHQKFLDSVVFDHSKYERHPESHSG
jgi:hypothetical protein